MALTFIKVFLLCSLVGTLPDANGNDMEREFDHFKEDIERFLETLLTKATSALSREDFIALPDTEESFRKKVAFINFHGGVQTFNGKLSGQSSLYKDGEIQATWAGDSTVNVEAHLAFRNLEIGTDARAWFGQIRKKFYMSAKVRHLKITVDLEFPLTSSGSPRVTGLIVRDMGKLSLDFRGLGPLNWLLEGLGYILNTGLRKTVKAKIQGILLNTINEEIAKTELSVI